MKLLDLYSGCGVMSIGLCLGANIAGVNLVKSLKENHLETEVRNGKAEDFLLLLKEWEKLCKHFSLLGNIKVQSRSSDAIFGEEDDEVDEDIEEEVKTPSGEFEVGKQVDICFGDPNEIGVQGLKLKDRVEMMMKGTLTIPPCTEGVICTIVKKVRTISREQVRALREAVDNVLAGCKKNYMSHVRGRLCRNFEKIFPD